MKYRNEHTGLAYFAHGVQRVREDLHQISYAHICSHTHFERLTTGLAGHSFTIDINIDIL